MIKRAITGRRTLNAKATSGGRGADENLEEASGGRGSEADQLWLTGVPFTADNLI